VRDFMRVLTGNEVRIKPPLILLWVTGVGCSLWMNFRSFKPLVVGSTPTAPTNHLPDWSGFNKFARGQKGADKAIDPVWCVSLQRHG
jgi:hypothetical protein